MAKHEDGWVDISAVGLSLREVSPGFRPKRYGASTLGALIALCSAEVEMKPISSVKSTGMNAGIVLSPGIGVQFKGDSNPRPLCRAHSFIWTEAGV